MNYSNYIVLLDLYFNGSMNGIVLFVYNTSVSEANRTCTVSGRIAWKTYASNASRYDYWYNQYTNSGWNIQYWLYYNTKLTCNGEERTMNTQDYNHRNYKGNGYLAYLPGVVSSGGAFYRSDLSDYVWYGGPYVVSDEVSWTLPYGDDTSRSYGISGTFGTYSGWTQWRYPGLSGTITLPYLENRSKINRTSNSGSSWNNDAWVWKTDNWGGSWYKVDLYKTTNSGSNWSKVR